MSTTPPVLKWIIQQPSFNTVANDQDPAIVSDSSGNSYIVYRTKGATPGNTSTSTTNFDIVILKLNTSGVVQWVKQYAELSNTDGSPIGSVPSITINSSGSHIYIAYGIDGIVSGGTSAGGADTVVVKLATGDGSIDWIKQLVAANTTFDDVSPSITCYTDGGADFIYVAYAYNNVGGKNAIYKLNSVGDFEWRYEVVSSAGGTYDCRIIADSFGNVYGSYDTDNSTIDVLKLDPNGNEVWKIEGDTDINPVPGNNTKSNIIFNDSLYVSYKTSTDIRLVKMDPSDGAFVAIKTLTPEVGSTLTSFQAGLGVDVSGNIYISYTSTGVSTKLTIVKVDSNMDDILWSIPPPDNINPLSGSIASGSSLLSVNSSGSIYVTYATAGVVSGGTNTGEIDIVIAKLGEADPAITNSFATKVNPYIALGPVLVFTKATIDALVAGTALPAQTTVSWAPMGMLVTGSLLRDLRRSVTVPVSATNRLAAYRFQRVQLIAGAGSEGVGGSPADIDAWQTGWICTWAASGVAPVF
jgi:hypothetical protein